MNRIDGPLGRFMGQPRNLIVAAIAAALLVITLAATAGPLDPRYCYTPETVPRTATGEIARSSAVRNAFRRAHPCPATGTTQGPCVGWEVDHVIPLACGGCDAVTNMQWLPVEIKRQHPQAKDRWERAVYCAR